MEMKRKGPGDVEFLLTKEEMDGMRLTYEGLDCRRPATRALLSALMEAAREQMGFEAAGRVAAEFCPLEDGGCSARLHRLPERFRVKRVKEDPAIYSFPDINTLIAGAVRLFNRSAHRIQKSDLYRLPCGWRLAVYPQDAGAVPGFMEEYAPRRFGGKLAAALLEEHESPLVRGNALDLIASYFG